MGRAVMTGLPTSVDINKDTNENKNEAKEAAFDGQLDLRSLVIYSYDEGKNNPSSSEHKHRLTFFASLNDSQRDDLKLVMSKVYNMYDYLVTESKHDFKIESNEEFYLQVLDALMDKSGFKNKNTISLYPGIE